MDEAKAFRESVEEGKQGKPVCFACRIMFILRDYEHCPHCGKPLDRVRPLEVETK